MGFQSEVYINPLVPVCGFYSNSLFTFCKKSHDLSLKKEIKCLKCT